MDPTQSDPSPPAQARLDKAELATGDVQLQRRRQQQLPEYRQRQLPGTDCRRWSSAPPMAM